MTKPTAFPRRRFLHACAAAGALPVLAACAGGPPTPPPAGAAAASPGSPPAPAAPGAPAGAGAAATNAAGAAAAPTTALSVERDWLRSWFEGTPVVIEQRGSGPLTVQVPLAFSFDPRRAAVKPALAAVLDKLAQSLRRTRAVLPLLAAPADRGPDAAANPALAVQRATAVRAYLLARGVPSARLGAPAAAGGDTVQLRAEIDPA